MKKKIIVLLFVLALAMNSMTTIAAVKTMPDGGKFDAAFYVATYPDVAAAFGNNETLLYQHFKTNGQAEGRRPYTAVKVMPDGGLFDAAFYAATYPDVAAAFGTNEALLYQHYVTNGKAEGRVPYAMGSGTVPTSSAASATPAAPAENAGQVAEAVSGKKRIRAYEQMRSYTKDPKNPDFSTTTSFNLNGILFSLMADFDKDGANEILYGDVATSGNYKYTVLHMLEKKGRAWKQSDAVAMYHPGYTSAFLAGSVDAYFTHYIDLDSERYKYFLYLYENGGKWNIVCEDIGGIDAAEYDFHSVNYNGSRFVRNVDFGVAGQNTHVDACLQRNPALVKGWGAEWEELVARFISESNRTGLACPAYIGAPTLYEYNLNRVIPLCAVNMDAIIDNYADERYIAWWNAGMKAPLPAVKGTFVDYTYQ